MVTTFFFLKWALLRSIFSATFKYTISVFNYSHHAVCYIPVSYVFITGSWCPLTSFTHFTRPLALDSGHHQFVLCISGFSLVVLRFHISGRSYNICLSLSAWFHSCMMPSGYTCVVAGVKTSFFFFFCGRMSVSRVSMPRFLCPFHHWWILRLFPCLGSCDVCCHERGFAWFCFLWMYNLEAELLDNIVVLFLSFGGTSILSSAVTAPIYISASSA